MGDGQPQDHQPQYQPQHQQAQHQQAQHQPPPYAPHPYPAPPQPWPGQQPGQQFPGRQPGRRPAQPPVDAYPAPSWQPGPTPYAAMRAAHTDRDRTVDVLKAAFAEGRLSAEEYAERFEAVNRAQTYGELARLVADLPAGPMVLPPVAAVPVAPPTFLPPPPAFRPAPPSNAAATASLVMGLLSVPTLGTLAVPAVIAGHVARSQIRRSGEGGDGRAVAGLTLGYLWLAGWTLLMLAAVLSAGH